MAQHIFADIIDQQPFHYFGLHDPTVDYDSIPEKAGALDEAALELALQTAQRVDTSTRCIV